MLYQRFYKYLGMSNGHSDVMKLFTKMLKPPFSTLQKQVFIPIIFFHDLYLQGSTRDECLENVHETVSLPTSFGFSIHKEKTVLDLANAYSFQGLL